MMESHSLRRGENKNPTHDRLTSRNLSRSITATDDTIRKDLDAITIQTTMDTLNEKQQISSKVTFSTMPTDSEVDSRDASPVREPIHRNVSSSLAHAIRGKPESSLKPRLTLSAFRRPEHTVRLTQSDPKRKLETDYNLHAAGCGVLGHGAFSTVRLAVRRRDGVKVAVKSIAKHDALRSRRLRLGGRRYLEEWEILRRMQNHPYVITLLDLFETDEEIQLVTEFCRGGELFDAIQKKRNRTHAMRRGQYSEAQAACITSQILRALADLHALDLVHRDVKPENIVIASNEEDSAIHVKLCDFGVARPLFRETDSVGSDGEASPLTPGRSRQYSAIGSDYYVAPEVVFGGEYDTSVDIYSLGVTLYILLCGFPPVFTVTDSEDAEVVFPSSYWKDISDDAKGLVRKMLARDPSSRISAKDALNDPWIARNFQVREHHSLPSRVQRWSATSKMFNNCDLQVNMDLVRTKLSKTIGNPSSSDETITPKRKKRAPAQHVMATPPKRARAERRASTALMALADLYRGVAVSPSAKVIAASVAREELNDVSRFVLDDRMELKKKQRLAGGKEEGKASFTAALSV